MMSISAFWQRVRPLSQALQGGHAATVSGSGHPGLVLDQWLGVLVPARTPPVIVARLNAEINKALADPAIRESFLQSAQEPVGGTAEQFSRLIHDDFEKYGRLVKDLKIKAN